MSFTALARRSRDEAFAAFGRPVTIDPDGTPRTVVAMRSDRSVAESFGPFEIVQHGRFFRFKDEDAPERGAVLAVLDEITGDVVERRVAQGAPIYADRRRLVVEVDTAPEPAPSP